jgi:hypothetical protein
LGYFLFIKLIWNFFICFHDVSVNVFFIDKFNFFNTKLNYHFKIWNTKKKNNIFIFISTNAPSLHVWILQARGCWSFEESLFQLYKLWGGSYNNRLGWGIGEFISLEWHAWVSPQTTNWNLLCVHYTKLSVQIHAVDMDISALHWNSPLYALDGCVYKDKVKRYEVLSSQACWNLNEDIIEFFFKWASSLYF